MQTHALTELETLRQMAAQKAIERQRLNDELLSQQEERLQLEHLALQEDLLRQKNLAAQEALETQERARIEEATLKQLELDKSQEQRPVSPSVEGTPKFQSEQLRMIEPTFSSNFGDLQNTVNAPTLRAVKVKDDYFFAPLNTDHDDYFNWVMRRALFYQISIEVKQGKPEAPRAKKPITFVDLSQDESGFINMEKLYPRTMDKPRIDDVEIIDVEKEKSNVDNEEAKDFEMGDDNILDEHRRKRDELLNDRKWFEMPPAFTSKGDSLPARPATCRNMAKPESLPPYIPPPQGAPDFLGRYGPPPVVNKNTRPNTPTSTNLANVANMVNQKFPNASVSERVSLTKSFAQAASSGMKKMAGPKGLPVVEESSPRLNNTPAQGSSKNKMAKDWTGWQQVKKKDFKPTNRGTNPCELHLRALSGTFGKLNGLYGKGLTD
ncbi:hypothetical protein M378DRAFT_18355 [Amanita muscaria Koide BX008]|uniref:Uncharacterized protein n=1 Tax=Amanita muscaria (strain Koide BX008) TaxID=946122 RepID=A0A0C2WFV9_AMAMK|nr:hypothetical protein M378DRAFT_18355 [Amanita muscaria Koide BX008]